jgi:lipopolysaccharide transport system permease protein
VKPHYATAWNDLVSGFSQWDVWTRLGWQEVRRRYRRTVLGPFWATLSIGMFIGGMAFIWAPLFKTDVSSYLPFLSAGLVTWAFITTIIAEGTALYTGGAGIITQLNFPYSILNFVAVWRNIIVFFHNVIIVVGVVLVLKVRVSWETLLLIPGLIIVGVNGIWMTLLLGMVGTRFRDIPPLIGNLIQILMFVTPVFWLPSQLGSGHYVITFNYMYHLIEVMRAPMLGMTPSKLSYGVTIVGMVLGFLVTFEFYARFRRRIPYWL